MRATIRCFGGSGDDFLRSVVTATTHYWVAKVTLIISRVVRVTTYWMAVQEIGSQTVDYTDAGSGVFVDLNTGTAQDGQLDGTDTLININDVTGSDFDDHIIGDAGNNSVG